MKKSFIAAMAVSLCLLTNSAFAVQEVIELDNSEETLTNKILFGNVKEKEIYSYSNYAESIESAGANVDIISRKDIKKQGSPSISELLNQTGSVYVQNANGSLGSTSSIHMRGTDRVRMTIDGIRADRTAMTSPGVEPQFLLSDDIERIEVIKGPQGNLAGTNASGGLIALRTRRGQGPLSIEAESKMGNLGTFKERFAIMGGDSKKDYYMGITWFKTDGGMKTDTLGNVEHDDYNNLNVVTNTGVRVLNEKADVRNIFRFSRARKANGIGSDQLTYQDYQAPNNYSLNYDIMDVLSFTHAPNEKYDYDAKFGIYHNEYNNYINPDDINSDPTYESISKIKSTRLNFLTQHNYKIFDWNTLSLGYNLETEFIDANSKDVSWGATTLGGYSGHTIQNDIFVNDLINIKDILFLRGGARLINNSDFGTYVTPNASAALVLPTFKIKGAKTKLRSSWGQSINNPTLYQRYGYADMGWLKSIPNPDLKAEKLSSWDIGITQSFMDEKLSFDFGYFNSHYNDYINYNYSYDPITWMSTGQYQNIDEARIQGFEAKTTWEPKPWFKAVASYTYTDSMDLATRNELPGCPRNSIKGMIYWTPIQDRLDLFAGVEAAEGRYMSSTSDQNKTKNYVDVKLGGNVKLFSYKGADVYLKGTIYNLLNQDISMYKTATNTYYAPGIHFTAGLFVKYTLPEKKDKL